MPFRFFRCCLTTILLVLFAITIHIDSLPGQSSTSKKPADRTISNQKPYQVVSRVDLVNVLCSVTDKNTNAFVTNLTKDDFILYENDKKQEIQNFDIESNQPLSLALLVDTSDSVRAKLGFEQEAAISFVQSVMREKDRGLLLQFASGVSLKQDFTDDPNKIAKEIRKLQAAGETSLYDAIYRICDEKMIRETGRKAIIILSDGEDASSETTLKQATELALRSEAIIFAISVNKGGFFGAGGEDKEGDAVLAELANQTGGRVFFPFKIEDLDESFRQISQELRSQYSIGYMSSNPRRDGSYRKLEIKVPERGLKLNYRKGYYAPTG
jgi:Ca-activated chloride channel homolog